MLNRLSRYERDCMMSANLAKMHRQPVDQVAKRVIDDAVDRFNQEWGREREAQKREAGANEGRGAD